MNRLQATFLGAALALGLAQAQAQPQQGPKQNMPDKGPAAAQVLPDFADLESVVSTRRICLSGAHPDGANGRN